MINQETMFQRPERASFISTERNLWMQLRNLWKSREENVIMFQRPERASFISTNFSMDKRKLIRLIVSTP